ncbi:nucleotidyltransferase family protein [Desulfomicrobium sp. ZS1]|uniref:nucleotidyltransferase family protein n=1 Tax=Desulfomicrobium sp. ZS1 TaxID=2952228 RepID=UPI0020B2D1F7|nr:nucleotidyltransferase family protein [Desulfomicrobium sp. ZS1]UTF50503.1 nucleotidyltransferase family protein [Desulfomicrobium sp. ZS1]
MTVRGVILAAGLGRRMGTVKQLLPFRGRPLLQHVIDAARASRLENLLLILGHAHDQVLPQLDTHGLEVIVNRDFAAGQSTSVRAGLEHRADADGIMYLLGDQPLLNADTINTLIDCFLRERPWAAVPVHHGQPGNPVIIGRPLMADLAALCGDIGARRLLRQSQFVRRVEVDDSAILRDVDTMEDYLALLATGESCRDEIFRP